MREESFTLHYRETVMLRLTVRAMNLTVMWLLSLKNNIYEYLLVLIMIILGESVNNGDLVLCAFAWNFFVTKEN